MEGEGKEAEGGRRRGRVREEKAGRADEGEGVERGTEGGRRGGRRRGFVAIKERTNVLRKGNDGREGSQRDSERYA